MKIYKRVTIKGDLKEPKILIGVVVWLSDDFWVKVTKPINGKPIAFVSTTTSPEWKRATLVDYVSVKIINFHEVGSIGLNLLIERIKEDIHVVKQDRERTITSKKDGVTRREIIIKQLMERL